MLHLATFLVRERVGLLKIADRYDLLDPATGVQVGIAQETPPAWATLLRFVMKKRGLPTAIRVSETEDGPALFTVVKPWHLFRATLTVLDGGGNLIGTLAGKWFSFHRYFSVLDAAGATIGELDGDVIGWNFRLVDRNGLAWGTITKRWAGIAKELFTSADNYVVNAEGLAASDRSRKILLLASALAVDVVFKEGDR